MSATTTQTVVHVNEDTPMTADVRLPNEQYPDQEPHVCVHVGPFDSRVTLFLSDDDAFRLAGVLCQVALDLREAQVPA